jgi:DNA-binding PadR family transcriptional regulator
MGRQKSRTAALSPLETILLALASTEQSGRDIAKRFEEEARWKISSGSLYTTFRRMKKRGLVTVCQGGSGDARFRRFNVTRSGINALKRSRGHYLAVANFGLEERYKAEFPVGPRRLALWGS